MWLARDTYRVVATYFNHPVDLPGVHWSKVDLKIAGELDRLIEECKPDVIVHNAAAANIDFCEREQALAKRINYESTLTIAKKCREFSIRLVYVSTDNVFDGEKKFYNEEDVPDPINFYGITKLRAEEAVMSQVSSFVIARAALIYGPPRLRGGSFSEWILERLKKGESVPVFTDQYRSPVYVEDLARALLELAGADWTGIVHLGGPERLNRYEFASKVCDVYGFSYKNLNKTLVDDIAGLTQRPRDLSFDITLAKKIVTFPMSDCRQGIERMFLKG